MDPKKIIFSFSHVNYEREKIIEDKLKMFLKSIDKENLHPLLIYILKEILANANKANLKRIHFQINKLDIDEINQYEKGIISFKDDTSIQLDKYLVELERMRFYVKIEFSFSNNEIFLIVSNNSKLLQIEKERINKRIERATKFNNLEEIMNEVYDPTESAGLGIVLIILLLRRIGLEENNFNVIDNENITEVRLNIPLGTLIKEEEFIADIIKDEIDDIPQFPQHIIMLQEILSNPNAVFSDLSDIINRDTSLIANLLKIANSSYYILSEKIKTIEEAVKFIGFRGIKDLVLTYSVQKMFGKKYDFSLIKEVIDHSVEVAYYAYELSREFQLGKETIEETYTSAILHDLGKIIINSLKSGITSRISKLCNDRGINPNLVENLTNGFNHSVIGAKLAEKWRFPSAIVNSIRYHHSPLEAKNSNKNLVSIIYLANILYYYKRKEYAFENIDYKVLDNFNLSDISKFQKTFDAISSKLENIEKITLGNYQ